MTTYPKPAVRFRTGLDYSPHPAVVMRYRTIVSDLVKDEETGLLVPDYDRGLISVQEDYSRSFVKQFLQFELTNWSVTNPNIKDITNTNRTPGQNALAVNGGAGILTKGIVTGTGAAAVTAADVALGTLIAHGTGAGQLSYAAMTFDADVAVVEPDTTFNMSRIMTNLSAGSISVTEIGVYGLMANTFCIIRDLLGAADAVAVGKAYTVVYTPATIA